MSLEVCSIAVLDILLQLPETLLILIINFCSKICMCFNHDGFLKNLWNP